MDLTGPMDALSGLIAAGGLVKFPLKFRGKLPAVKFPVKFPLKFPLKFRCNFPVKFCCLCGVGLAAEAVARGVEAWVGAMRARA